MTKKIRHRKCKYSECRISFRPERYGQSCCSVDHAIKYAKELERKKRDKDWKQRKGTLKEKVKGLGEYKKELQIDINQLARELDSGHGCISCGNTRNVKYNGGHFHSVGSNPSLRFNLLNIYLQCEYCNQYLSGNVLGYLDGLKNNFGSHVLEEVQNALRNEINPQKWTIDEIKEARKVVKAILRQIKNQKRPFSNVERIELRRELNQEIGLYK